METITFTCEVITPMFLAGADGTQPELRAPSIKGAMRFWWRAMNGHLSIDELRRREAELFGGSEGDGKKSSFNVRINIRNKQEKTNFKNEIWDFNSKQPKNGYEGIAYLLYSTFMKKDEEKGYYSSLTFDITLSSNSKEKLKKAASSLWLLSIFGGLGTRSRRGGGNFKIIKVVDSETIMENIEFICSSSNDDDFINWLDTNYKAVQDITKEETKHNNNNIEFSTLKEASVYVLPNENSWMKALNNLGVYYKDFRSKYQPDYSTVKDFINTGNSNNTVEKSAFGLPIQYRYRSLPQEKNSCFIEGKHKDRKRQASPIIFKIIKAEENLYFPLIVYMNSNFLCQGDSIMLSSKGKPKKSVPLPSNNIITDFINSIKEKEVITL